MEEESVWLVLGAEGGGEVDRGDAEEAGGYVAAVGNYGTQSEALIIEGWVVKAHRCQHTNLGGSRRCRCANRRVLRSWLRRGW